QDDADVPAPNSVSQIDRSFAPTLLLQSKSDRPNGLPVPKSVSHADRSFAPTPEPPSRSNADTVGEPINVPFANTRPPFKSVVALPAPFEPPSTMNCTLPRPFVNLRVVFAPQFTVAFASSWSWQIARSLHEARSITTDAPLSGLFARSFTTTVNWPTASG